MTERKDFVSTCQLIVERLLGSDQMEEIRSQIENRPGDPCVCISYEKKIFLHFSGSAISLELPNRFVRVYERCKNSRFGPDSGPGTVVLLYDNWQQVFAWRWKALAMCLIDLPRILDKAQKNVCIEIRDP